MKNDIREIKDIQLLVDSFYQKVQADPVIGGIFVSVIKDWPKHLEKMYRFWQTVLLEEHTYHGSPFPPHAQMPLTSLHFDRWLSLWRATVDSYFEGAKADEAKWRGEKMAALFLSKIEFFRDSNNKALL